MALRGVMRKVGDLKGRLPPRSRGGGGAWCGQAGEGPTLRCTHDNEVRGALREGDSRSLKGGVRLCSSHSGPARRALTLRSPSGRRARLVSPSCSARSRTKAKAQGGSSPPPEQNEESMQRVVVPVRRRIAEVGRTPSGSEKRGIGGEEVESLLVVRERVNGSLPTGSLERVSASVAVAGKKGAVHRGTAVLIT